MDLIDIEVVPPQSYLSVGGWSRERNVSWKEIVREGLENAPEAFINLFAAGRMGNALVKV